MLLYVFHSGPPLPPGFGSSSQESTKDADSGEAESEEEDDVRV